ncbi:hypothetical protein vBAcePPAc_0051 [Aeromonas phage vB_AceP_PAc]|nr:hypothetical protein vBAcePPAc_0051 [Aeromonas phage vB_AceP_PAc]
MQKVYTSRQKLIEDLSKNSDIDYEKTFSARELAFVTKNGEHYWFPVWHLYVKGLIEFANAKLVLEGCHKYPRTYIMLYKNAQDEQKELDTEPETKTEEDLESKPKQKGRQKSTK